MAALHHGATAAAAALHHRRFTVENISLVKPVFFVSSSSTLFLPAKHARRRNHLREKILKTLKNPMTPKLPPANPVAPIESPPQEIKEVDVNQEIQEFEKSESSELAENEETRELRELKDVEVSAPSGAGIDGGIGVAGKDSVLKCRWWFVGAFVFQTVCAVMYFGLDDIDNKREIVNGSGELRAKDAVLDENGIVKMGMRNNGIGDGNVNVDLEMERTVEEIRLMAREVREKERLQLKRNGGDVDDDERTDGGKSFKSGIEEEVDGTMVKLKKKLGNTRFEMPLVGNSTRETKR